MGPPSKSESVNQDTCVTQARTALLRPIGLSHPAAVTVMHLTVQPCLVLPWANLTNHFFPSLEPCFPSSAELRCQYSLGPKVFVSMK